LILPPAPISTSRATSSLDFCETAGVDEKKMMMAKVERVPFLLHVVIEMNVIDISKALSIITIY
jgi:hypothetical protein